MDRLPITGCTREENCDSPLQTDCLRQTVPGKIPVTEQNVTDHITDRLPTAGSARQKNL